jgi:hypothetical protein
MERCGFLRVSRRRPRLSKADEAVAADSVVVLVDAVARAHLALPEPAGVVALQELRVQPERQVRMRPQRRPSRFSMDSVQPARRSR